MRPTTIKTIGYCITTGLIALAFLVGGAIDVAHPPGAIALLTHLGYPEYFAPLIGVWKVLGALALIAPRFPRLKEWAYAGIIFDVTGAATSHAVTGDSASNVVIPLVLAAVALASWALRPQSRRLQVAVPAPAEAAPLMMPAKVAA